MRPVYGATTLNATELGTFGTLNQLVQGAAPATTPVHRLIGAWYPGSFAAAPVKPTASTVPSGRAGNVAGYNDVYGKSCRTRSSHPIFETARCKADVCR